MTLPNRWNELIPSMNTGVFFSIIYGAFLSFYAYIGFEDMVNMAEEVKNPERNMPLSIITVLIITTILYVLVSLVAVLSLPLEQLSSSEAPFVDIISQKNDSLVSLIGVISLVAVVNGMLIQIIMGSRVLYGMSKADMAPKILSYIYPRTQVPIISTTIVFIFIVFAALFLKLVPLAKLTSTIILFVFASVNLSLVVIKLKENKLRVARKKDHIYLPVLIPIIGFILCISFLILQLGSI
jgi:amino acid transporter